MGTPKTELMITPDGPLKLPPAHTDGAHQLFQIIDRMPQLVPSSLDPGPIISAIAVEANKLDLRGVDASSIIVSAFNIACLGLMPGPMGYVHMIPFRDRKRGDGRYAQVVVGYKGWRELAYRNGFLSGFACEAVMDHEDFDCWRDSDGLQLYHDLSNPNRHVTWDKIRLTYCQWKSTAGFVDVARVGKEELAKLKAKQKNVWDTNAVAMALKTPILRARKAWRDTAEIAAAGLLDEYAERGEVQPPLPGIAELVEPDKPPVTLGAYSPDRGFRQKIDECNGDRDQLRTLAEDIAGCQELADDTRRELLNHASESEQLSP